MTHIFRSKEEERPGWRAGWALEERGNKALEPDDDNEASSPGDKGKDSRSDDDNEV